MKKTYREHSQRREEKRREEKRREEKRREEKRREEKRRDTAPRLALNYIFQAIALTVEINCEYKYSTFSRERKYTLFR
jgi:hypothetical protein